jgi:hypothetical protein
MPGQNMTCEGDRMAIPVDADGPTWKWVAVSALAVVQILFGWMAKGVKDELKSQGSRLDRMDDLHRTYVTRDELERHSERLEASSLRMHADNKETNREMKETMQRIEEKLEHGGQTRHGILDGVNAVQLMLRSTLEQLKQERTRKP